MLLTLATDEDLRNLWDKTVDEETAHAAAAMAARLGVTKDEAHRLSWVCQYWCWLHWGQWGSMTTDSDIAELQHLIQEFYTRPPMSAFWAQSPYVRMLDPAFVEFVNAALASASKNELGRDRRHRATARVRRNIRDVGVSGGAGKTCQRRTEALDPSRSRRGTTGAVSVSRR
jgi:hypothetical protein